MPFPNVATRRELEQREEQLRQRERHLPADNLLPYRSEISRKIKDPDTYAVLAYGLGFGLQHLYLGRYTFFLIDLAISLIFWVNLFIYIFVGAGMPWQITVLALCYNIVDMAYCLIRSQAIVLSWNLDMSEALLERFGAPMRSADTTMTTPSPMTTSPQHNGGQQAAADANAGTDMGADADMNADAGTGTSPSHPGSNPANSPS